MLLYIFLIVAIFVVYKDLKEPSSSSAKLKRGASSSTRVVILESPGMRSGATFFLTDQTVIGRSPECDIEIADNSVSHHHASISRDGASFKVQDLGSKNGTYMNQRKILGPTRVKHGDIIKVGKTTFEFMEQ